MTKYECNVNGSQNEAGITITVSDGSVIESFTVSDAKKLNDLIQQIKQFDDKYVDIDELKTVLKNESQKDVINATNLNGLSSDKYAKSSDLDKYSTVPTNHSSRTVEYGVGDTNNYGHLKITDNLSETDPAAALSCKAGNELNNSKMGNNYEVSAVTGADNMYAHRIGDIVILSWWGRSVSKTNNWTDWKTLPYTSANTQHIWTSVYSTDTNVNVRIPPNSDKIQINVSNNGNIGAGFIVYPTK